MRPTPFTLVLLAALALPATALADAERCCDHKTETCEMKCCQHEHAMNGVEMLVSLGSGLATVDEVFPPPVQQRAVVWFHRPVWVGGTVLMGKYIIEHDTDRQARGEPCTHIYAADKPTTPVVTFHCTHLEGEGGDRGIVMLKSLGDGSQRLLWFQFAGEDAAHGYPAH